jgi:ParB/RepB/Spo0J family partition protein
MSNDTQLVQLAFEQLHESPFNPRQVFKGVEELAANIRAEGRVHQPLLVRPRSANTLVVDGPPEYEVVFGHRRLRAAELAGLTHVPCMVRAMTDAEVRSAQAAENLQRVDIHPIEEAESYRTIMDVDGVNADDLAARIGKSRSHVYGRLKLLQACPEVRTACVAGEIGSEVALLVARLGHPTLQAKALQAIKGKALDMKDGGQQSYRRIRSLLNEQFTLHLVEPAPIFDPDDATLVPAALPCAICPKRSGNAPEYQDLIDNDTADNENSYGFRWLRRVGPDVCTDPTCYAEKKAAQLAREAKAMEADGLVVVSGNKAKAALDAYGTLKAGFVPADKVKAALKQAKAKSPHVPVPVMHVQDPRTGKVVQAVREADLVAAGVKEAERSGGGDSDKCGRGANRDWQAERLARQKKHAAEQARRLGILKQLHERLTSTQRTLEDLQLLARALADNEIVSMRLDVLRAARADMPADNADDWIGALGAEELGVLCIELAILPWFGPEEWELEQDHGAVDSVAEHYGLDSTNTPADPDRDPNTADLFAEASHAG